MKNQEKMKMARKLVSHFGGLGLALLAPAAVLAPGCKFESCSDTNSCGPEKEDDSLGGQGGAGEMDDPDEGTGGDEMEGGLGGEGAGDGTGANGTGGDEPVLTCDDGEVACGGECVDPLSDAEFCGAEGTCEGNKAGTVCEQGEICVDGGCEPDCNDGEVACDGECVDPLSDAEYCGAEGACEGEEAGQLCGEGEICVEGGCELDCLEGEVACAGSCVDSLTDDAYCGADSACEGFSVCSEIQQCISGGCAGWGEDGSANFGTGSDSYVQPGQLTIDGTGEVFFAWARPAGAALADVQTSQLVVDAQLWGLPEVRDSEAAAAFDIQMETNSAGRSVLVWRQVPDTEPDAAHIWSSVREPGSDWGAATPISGTLAGSTSEVPVQSPHLTLDEEGNAYVVWSEDFTLNLVVNSLKAGETTWGTPATLELPMPKPWDLRGVSIQSLADGEALVVFRDGVPGSWTWYSAASVEGVFGVAAPAFDATHEGASSPAVASNEEEAALFWVGEDSAGTALDFGQVSFYREGAWTDPTYIRTPGTVAPLREPEIAIDSEGNITAAWISGTDTNALWSASLEAGAEEWIFQEEPVAVGVGGESLKELVLALDGLGNVQLAWIQEAVVADSVWAARRRAGSSDFDAPRIIEDWEAVPVSGLAMEFNEAGQGVIAWWTTDPLERTLGFNYFR